MAYGQIWVWILKSLIVRQAFTELLRLTLNFPALSFSFSAAVAVRVYSIVFVYFVLGCHHLVFRVHSVASGATEGQAVASS